MAFYM